MCRLKSKFDAAVYSIMLTTFASNNPDMQLVLLRPKCNLYEVSTSQAALASADGLITIFSRARRKTVRGGPIFSYARN